MDEPRSHFLIFSRDAPHQPLNLPERAHLVGELLAAPRSGSGPLNEMRDGVRARLVRG
jgi:hypothetical protein